MRVADYIFKFLADRGVTDVFLVTGGGAMFLNDAIGREKRLKYICNLSVKNIRRCVITQQR